MPLKAGTEVVVAHVNGDPDRPIIVGAVPDLGAKSGKGWRDSPVTSENRDKLIIKTNETELSIDDTDGKARWRTQVADRTHVHLIGWEEQGESEGVKAPMPERGFGLASENNYTATVNQQMTLESTTYSALQQMSTVLTADKHLDYVGEDPGFEDWKKFEEQLAKLVDYQRHLVDMLEETKKLQKKRAKKRTSDAKKKHRDVQRRTVKKINEERETQGVAALQQRHDENEDEYHERAIGEERARLEAEKQDGGDCPECKEAKRLDDEADALDKKREEVAKKRTDAGAALYAAGQRQNAAQQQAHAAKKNLQLSPAEHRPGAQAASQQADADLQKADRELADAQATHDAAQAEHMPEIDEVHAKRREAQPFRDKCNEARKKKESTVREGEQLERQKAADDSKAQAEAAEKRVTEFWKRADAKLKAGEAVEIKDLEKAKKDPDKKKDLWSKLAKEMSDKAHETHLTNTKARLDEAKASLQASTEREKGDGGSFEEPYSMSETKHSTGILAGDNMYMYGGKHLTLHSPEIAHIISGDTAHVKAETGVEVATDDWIKLTSTKTVDVHCDKEIQLVAAPQSEKKMPGGHTMLFFSHKGINMESETAKIEGTALTSIELTAKLANVDIKASAGQIVGMGMAGIRLSTPAMIDYAAGGMVMGKAGGMMNLQAGGMGSYMAGGSLNLIAGAAATMAAGGIATVAGAGLLLL